MTLGRAGEHLTTELSTRMHATMKNGARKGITQKSGEMVWSSVKTEKSDEMMLGRWCLAHVENHFHHFLWREGNPSIHINSGSNVQPDSGHQNLMSKTSLHSPASTIVAVEDAFP
uniref:Uncharacterized protein n=1 Tax=Nelumbo nucifera TaxID=4432 RepID=A0A822XUD3_NELNU|nr:TPA_asm: hypothetical protein HUJ06_024244 [Nelumbo nucifera]